jgi:hypothetical protein
MFTASLCAQSRIEKLMADLSFVSFDIDKLMMEVDPLLFGDYCCVGSNTCPPKKTKSFKDFQYGKGSKPLFETVLIHSSSHSKNQYQ